MNDERRKLLTKAAELIAQAQTLVEAAERGQLVPVIGRIVPLSKTISAVVEIERTGSPKGKLVIVPKP
jgi:hypothetical protein